MKSLSMPALQVFALGIFLFNSGKAARSAGAAPSSAVAAEGQVPTAGDLTSLKLQAMQEGEASKTADAIGDYRRALKLDPNWKEGWWNLGFLEYGANHFSEAETAFAKVVAFAPNTGLAWSLLGLSEFEMKQYSSALDHLERAQSLGNKDDAEIERVSNYHLGLLLIRAGQFDRASNILLNTFGNGEISAQAKAALGLATLRVPLLPDQVDPSKDALILEIGNAAAAGQASTELFRDLADRYPEVPYIHYALGLALEKAGDDKQAIAAFLEETRVSPERPGPWIELSRVQARLGQSNEDLKSAEMAVKIAPKSPDAHGALADALKGAGKADQAAAEQKLSASFAKDSPVPESRIVARYSNGNVAAQQPAGESEQLWTAAMREYAAGDYSSARDHLREWLRSSPEDGTSWAVLGLSEFALKDYGNALVHLDRGAKLGLSGSLASVQLAKCTYGILLVHAGEFDRATQTLASAIGGSLDDKIKFALGLALLRRAMFPDSPQAQPADMFLSAGRISLLLQQSKYDAAFPQFKALLARYPNEPFLHYAYGTALLAVSEFDEAAAQMRAELPISPESELPFVRLASIALRQHKAAEAITWAKSAISLAPNSVEGHYLLGRASLETGDDPTAVRELEIAARLSPGSPEIHFNLAKAYARAKMPDKAQLERATFARLNEVAEIQKSHQGSQVYAGPHGTADVTTSPAGAETPSSPRP